ncbi:MULTISPECIES: alpha-D-ribose 1-methylphosphonate 5-triphosphate diphosphatase [unclassified Minwuia]|jgi:alpha-D-ribose 1-methylphosphonate 5-triphosphate diphosphatase|uniref:alpha-D-ribose 1-methylphosphonate 5-triphosphate diphosphatase n=1 Tax=unclassified Minwuia TaxID=2618799 RepID=UPI0024797068|nr:MULTISPECIES: alpha-D-ribose 1-methylphosphonate 5-triphosphate diphosphatase [unclassified Minwuia]
MSQETLLKNARLVLEDEVVTGSVLLRDGLIADVGGASEAAGDDMGGDYLLPGLVELHTDHLEGHYAPRPKVRWNPFAAVQAHDAQIASSAITTVFDALRVGNTDGDHDLVTDDMVVLAEAIQSGMATGRLRADHFLHLRCEVSSPDCLAAFERLGGKQGVRLASLMDHAPGQRQFANLDAYKIYYQGKLKMTDAEFAAFCDMRVDQSRQNSDHNRGAIAEIARQRGIVLASHDDATREHVDEAEDNGVRVAEFPTTEAAARSSHERGMAVLMGAPNVVRGGSHSGNIAAQHLAELGLLDILSSDYIPFSLIQATFQLAETVDGISLPQAVGMATHQPARSVGLDDRGVIAVGKRADLARVRVQDGVPVVRTVWRQGERVV